MNKKIMRLIEPSMRLYLIFLVLFAAVTLILRQYYLAAAEGGIIILLLIYSAVTARRRRKKLLEYIEDVTYNVDSATKDTSLNFPLPMLICRLEDDQIIWSNEPFLTMVGDREHMFEVTVGDLIPDFSMRWLVEGKTECPSLILVNGRRYKVFGSMVRSDRQENHHSFLGVTYWVDVTEYADIKEEYGLSRPVAAIILLDNYEELFKTEAAKSSMMAAIEEKVNEWVQGLGGLLCKYDRDRYLFLFEERHLDALREGKFSLLESVRSVVSPAGVAATVSIGIGRDGESLEENFQFASLGIEMALSRGGDQAVVKNRFNFEFYGGRAAEVEKHTKVKTRVMASALGELIDASSFILIMTHKMADLDGIGAAIGLSCIARKKGRRAYIIVHPENNASKALIARMKQLPEYEGAFITAQQAMVMADVRTLLIVADTNRPDQTEAAELLGACQRIAVIDHHRRAAEYISNATLNFHEPYASSACELVAELLQYLTDQQDILRYEAEAVLSGIVLDTKNFTLRTGGRTFDAAAFLRRAGADTTEVKRLLQNDFKSALEKYAIVQKAKIYKDGIAIAALETQEDRVVAAQAADELLNILGIKASFVVFMEGDAVAISGRSIGNINVQIILEKLGGGGNRAAAGAQIKGGSTRDVLAELLKIIDKYLLDNRSQA